MGNVVYLQPIRWDILRTDEAERVIRKCAENTEYVIFHNHAFDRIDERGITQVDALRILRTGYVDPKMERLPKGDWKVIVRQKQQGNREAGMVTVILEEGRGLFVRTVMWVD